MVTWKDVYALLRHKGERALNQPVIVKLPDRLMLVKSICYAVDYESLDDLPPDQIILDVTFDACESTVVDDLIQENNHE